MRGIPKGQTRKYPIEMVDMYVKLFEEDSQKLKLLLDKNLYVTVSRKARKLGIVAKRKYKENKWNMEIKRNCMVCGTEFTTTEGAQKKCCTVACTAKHVSNKFKYKCDCMACDKWYSGSKECGRQDYNMLQLPHIIDHYISNDGVLIPTECTKYEIGRMRNDKRATRRLPI